MSIFQRLSRLDDRVGLLCSRPRPGESRRDYLASIARSLGGSVPNQVYLELVELHDKVASLEARVELLERQ